MNMNNEGAQTCELVVGEFAQKVEALPMVELPGDNSPLLKFALKLRIFLHDKGIYRRGDVPMYVNAEEKRVEVMGAATFRSWIEVYVVCFTRRIDSRGFRHTVLRTMNTEMSDGVLKCMDFYLSLRKVERVNPVPKPVLREDGRLAMLRGGYDAETKTLTFK